MWWESRLELKVNEAIRLLRIIEKQGEKIMALEQDLAAVIDDLTTAVANNTAEIETLLTKIATPGVSPQVVAESVEKIRALVTSINAEVAKAQE